MRKRLMEKLAKSKKGSPGYTLTELLVVIAIIAVMCAIAIPSIITINRALKFRQRNDYAKTIFLAAQANLSEMRSDGSLGMLQGTNLGPSVQNCSNFPNESWTSQYVYVTGADATRYAIVLPLNSVESTLRDKQVIIEYNPYTGNVYSVFYSEEDESIYDQYVASPGLPRNDLAARKSMMLGYYDGSGLAGEELEAYQTKAELEFVNGEEGIIEVRVPVPDKYYADLEAFKNGLSVTLTITSDTNPERQITVPIKTAVEANPGAASTVSFTLTSEDEDSTDITLDAANSEVTCYPENGNTMVVAYTLDSLVDYGSFANKAMREQASDVNGLAAGSGNAKKHLTQAESESDFLILPGENVTVTANVTFTAEDMDVAIESGILPGINPLFEYLEPGTSPGKYVLAISNGRNLQNLNVLSPGVAANVETVVFTDDVDWNDTVSYYNNKYGKYESSDEGSESTGSQKTYANQGEAPARCLPYFVPISNEALFGSAYFINGANNLPTLEYTHDVDTSSGTLRPVDHADIVGDKHCVVGLNIDATKYAPQTLLAASGKYYVANDYNYTYKNSDGTTVTKRVTNNQRVNYYFTGLFAYANTYIDGLNIVNPIVKGHPFAEDNGAATGSLLGASGYNSLVTNCGVYIDKSDRNYKQSKFVPYAYDKNTDQTWYGVSGEGAVGGLVGYAKSHRTASGDLTDNASELAFSYCFAAVPVSGNMYPSTAKAYGYINGVGGFIGNSELTNFYSCYSSGKVYATGCFVWAANNRKMDESFISGIINSILPSNVLVNTLLEYDGYYSMGAGGFVGSSHGTRYTNCFTTGDVEGRIGANTDSTEAGVGGFVGIMCYDEGFTYSANGYNRRIQQLTVFDSCYSTGKATINGKDKENFSGANARIFKYDDDCAIYADYYKLLAPYYFSNERVPVYPSVYSDDEWQNASYYIYKDSYYLSRNYSDDNINEGSNECASVVSYDTLTNLTFNHSNDNHNSDQDWVDQRVNTLGEYRLDAFETWLSQLTGLPVSFGQVTTYAKFFDCSTGYWYFDPFLQGVFRLLGREETYWTDSLKDVYKSQLQEGFPFKDWTTAFSSNTHPYTMSGGKYPFSKLVGLDYYGDWPTRPLTCGLAYYEGYVSDGGDSTTYGIYLDTEATSTIKTQSEMGAYTLVSDGYAVVTANESDTVTVTVENSGKTYTLANPILSEYVPGGEYGTKSFAVFPLTKAIMDEAAKAVTAEDFYVCLTVTVKTANQDSSAKTYTLYFNPNVAKSNINPNDGSAAAEKPDNIPEQILIRTARQLAALSSADQCWGKSYGTGDNARDYRYVQDLDIDFASYTASSYGGDKTAICKAIAEATPIGTAEKPFNASYNGMTDKHSITRDVPKTDSTGETTVQTAPLFGVIGETGSVRNLAVYAGVDGVDIILGSADADNIGIVANEVNGTLENVDLKLVNSVAVTAKENAGLAVGKVTGNLTNVNVASAVIASVNAENAGGVVGLVAGAAESADAEVPTVTDCGIRFTDTLILNGTNCGGFAGSSSGLAQNGNVTLNGLTVKAKGAAGGYAGLISGSDQKSSAVNNCTVTLNGVIQNQNTDTGSAASEIGSVLGGFAGTAEKAVLTDLSVTLNAGGSLKAQTAAGFVGKAMSGLDIKNTKVTLAGSVAGDGSAAGFACIMEAGSKFTACDATVSGTISAPHAAGFVVAAGGTVDSCFTTLKNGRITGTETAAGFAVTVSATGSVYGTGGSGVVGAGSISAPTAAGFVVVASGRIAAGRVTPAYSQTKKAYLDVNTDYGKLTITGSTTAAGFAAAAEQGAVIMNCDAVGTVAGGAVSCFAASNAGTVDGCMANVVVPQDKTCYFVGENAGTVSNCYGWFGDGASTALANFEVSGTCYSSYFADIDVMVEEGSSTESVVLYTSGGVKKTMDPTTLKSAVGDLSTTGKTWYEAGYFTAYPFSQSLRGNYPYPMLRAHSGNWVGTPQYAYGVIYYEQYSDGSVKYHVVDLSDYNYTVETGPLSKNGEFTDNGTITAAGYAIFCNSSSDVSVRKVDGTVIRDGIGEVPENGDLANILNTIAAEINGSTNRYHVYPLNAAGQVIVYGIDAEEDGSGGETPDSGTTSNGEARVVTYYADAINAGEDQPYQIRTGEQFSNIRQMSDASFLQTHNLALDNAYAAMGSFGGIYDGNGYTVSAQTLSGLINNVTGTITNMRLAVEEATGSIFGTIVGKDENGVVSGGIVRNSTISVGKTLSSVNVIGTVGKPGTVQDSTISVNEAAGSVIGTVSGSVLNSKIYVKDARASDACFGVAASKVDGALTDITIGWPIGEEISNTIVSMDGKENVTSVIGGAVGVNTGTISGGSVKVTINYTQAASGDNAVIGGLVGRMDGGHISDIGVSGAVNLARSGDEAPVTAGRSYIIGGAIGKDNVQIGTIDNENVLYTYSNVGSAVAVDSDWSNPNAVNDTPCQDMGQGPVGMFVGYAGYGSFDTCYSSADNETYQFLGQIAVTPATLAAQEGGTWFRNENPQGSTEYEISATDVLNEPDVPESNLEAYVLQLFAKQNYFEELKLDSENKYHYSCCNATLNNCTFKYRDQTYTQAIQPKEYYYNGESHKETGYALVPAELNYGTAHEVTYKDLYSGYSSITEQPTNYLYKSGDRYYEVTVNVDVNGKIVNQYTYQLFANGELLHTSNSMYNYERSDQIHGIQLYDKPTTVRPGKYLITDPDATCLFNGSTGEAIPYDSNGRLRTNQLPLWTVSGNTWCIVQDGQTKYLSLTSTGLTSASSKTINVNSNENAFSLMGQGSGASYLYYAGNQQFRSTTTQTQSKLGLFRLEPLPDTFKCTFTYGGANSECLVLKDNSPVELSLMTMSETASAVEIADTLAGNAEKTAQSIAETTNSSGENAGGEAGNEGT